MKTSFLLMLVLISYIGFSQINQVNTIAQWRGVNRDGQYNDTRIQDAWPDKGPKLDWSYEGIGNGFSAPSVSNRKIFVNGEIEGMAYLFVFDLNGRLLWKSPNGKEFTGSDYAANFPGARTTPTVVGNLVYATTGIGRIACFETSTGKEKWAIDMVKDFSGWLNEFGYAESVAVDDKNVYCFPGGKETNVAALDRFTGKTIWTSKALGDTTSFCSPILVKLPSRDILVTLGRHYLFVIDCKNGELLGSYKLKGFKYDGEHCNTPIYAGGYLYSVAKDEDGQGAVKLKLSADAKQITEVWTNNKVMNGFGGFVIIGNKLFTTIEGNWLKAVNVETGTVSDSLKVPFGSLIYADGKFIGYGNNGEVSLIKYNQSKLEITGKLKITKGTKEHFSHLVVAGGVMYIRHGNALMAYNLK
jgi:outer membrane protein assembly factor BamB